MTGRKNNFDLLRLAAALAVLWSHAFAVSSGAAQAEPLSVFSRGQSTLGSLAVSVFFVISGYLITGSFERRVDTWSFINARVLRIMPGLSIVVLLSALLLGPAVTTLSAATYFTAPESYAYIVSNLTFLQLQDRLPGVFEDNPLPWINGSLWTLRYEIECYGLVLLLGVCGLLTRRFTLCLFLALLVYLALATDHTGIARMNSPRLSLVAQFLAGALLFQWRTPMNVGWAFACVVGSLLALRFGGLWLAQQTIVPYLVIWSAIGARPRLSTLFARTDLSYGTYLYAWPVEQIIVMHRHPRGLWIALIATPIVLLLAFLSWHAIEKFALSWKTRSRALVPSSQPS
jgi:peptidoglycan/LPS O-acetylase OafA/YrhL